jgi:hypothetical protein
LIQIDAAARLALAALVAAGDLVTFRQSSAPPASLTPGGVALLANSGDAGAVEQLRTALTHKDPTVRAVGARVVGIAKARDCQPTSERQCRRKRIN